MIRLVNIDDLSPTSPAWEDVLKLEIWEPKDIVLWYLTQNNITRIDDTRKGYEKTYKLVEYGRWINTGEIWTDMYTTDENPMYKCSVCNEEVIGGSMHFAYCPWCGAKMDGGEE